MKEHGTIIDLIEEKNDRIFKTFIWVLWRTTSQFINNTNKYTNSWLHHISNKKLYKLLNYGILHFNSKSSR